MTDSTADITQAIPEPPLDTPRDLPTSDALPSRFALRSRLAAWSRQLTIADGIMALVVILAAAVRFYHLGQPLLSPSEATAALGSWQFTQAGTDVTQVTSPAYFTLTNAVMLILGSSDAIARLVPAIAGTLTVGLVWFLRRVWGSAGFLTAALFLTLSPLNILVSRTAGGQAIAVFALMLLIVSIIRVASNGGKQWAYGIGLRLVWA
ncbi:MAG: glycosyltransferase family 39 protein [Chloroflexota bacterium]